MVKGRRQAGKPLPSCPPEIQYGGSVPTVIRFEVGESYRQSKWYREYCVCSSSSVQAQFYYFKGYDNYSEPDYTYNNSKDQFIINSIDVVGIGDKENIDLSTSLRTNYYGIDSYVEFIALCNFKSTENIEYLQCKKNFW